MPLRVSSSAGPTPVGRADARQHQQLWRLQCAGGQHDLAARAERAQDAMLAHLDADRAHALEQDALDVRVRLDMQVPALSDVRQKIGTRCTAALALFLRHLVNADSLLLDAIEVLRDRQAGLARRLDEAAMEGIVRTQVADPQRSAVAVPCIMHLFVVLAEPEVGQDIVERPAAVAECGPMIVVPAVAARIDHGVDGG
jgi:hypothetical protein